MQLTPLLTEGASTLGVRDSSVESLNIMLVIQDLNLLIMKVYVKLTFT